MKMRAMLAMVIMVGLTAATMTWGQATTPASGGGSGLSLEKGKQRTQVARLRAEVELLQIEHDVDAEHIKETMTALKNLDGMAALQGPAMEQIKALRSGTKGQAPVPGADSPLAALQPEDFGSKLDEATVKVTRPYLDLKKKEFLQKAAALQDKKLELAELEKQYNAAR